MVAELGDDGIKQFGYIFAGSMRIATQYIYGSSSGVGWTSTSPATGSEYMTDGTYLDRKELDPLGEDVTVPPPPDLVSEPIFYDPKFTEMPLEIAGGPSEEYERANQERATLMAEASQALQDRDQAEKLWQSGKRNDAMAILAKNPNVGIEFRVIHKNEVIRHGSYFGKNAADFLNGINIATNIGLLKPLTRPTAQDLPDSVPLSKEQRDTLLADFAKLLKNRNDCLEFVSSLLATVATNTARPLYNTQFISDPAKIFTSLQKGVVLKPMKYGGLASGSLGGGDAKMEIKEISWIGFSWVRGMIITHESTHFAPAEGKFSDQELAWAGYEGGLGTRIHCKSATKYK